jgi:hypothetical protein
MKEITTIPKTIGKEYGPGYQWLRDSGLKHIEKMAGKIWTDYNTHDPGITILELLCWVITDLDYRISVPVEDIVAVKENNLDHMHRQFISALNILPVAPVTADDYRKLFIRIDGVKNAWLQKAKQPVIATYKPQPVQMRYAAINETAVEGEEFLFNLNGLYNILLDLETNDEEKKKEIFKKARSIYHHFRNLGEDLVDIKNVDEQEIVVCADIELQPKADPEETWAQIVYSIREYLSPSVNFYTLQQMVDKGKSTDEIFDGPVFNYASLAQSISSENIDPFAKKGFVDDAEIKASALRTEVRLSDIIRIIEKLDGVKLIKSIAFGFCGCDETDPLLINKAVDKSNWLLCVKPGHKPTLCLTNSVFNFNKDVIPVEIKRLEANESLYRLIEKNKQKQEAAITEDLPMPTGRFRDIQSYNSLQNHLPETYGIGLTGLPESVSVERKSLALQLKAYLLFFDQVLANYFSQLSHVKELLSTDSDLKQTYFSNIVHSLKDGEKIFKKPGDWLAGIDEIMLQANLDNYVERKNKFLDHLLARFSEQFSEYVFLLHRIYGSDYDQAIIRQKKEFYKDYTAMSMYRADGLDYFNKKSDFEKSINVSGMEKRLSRMLGINHYKTDKKISQLPYFIFKVNPANSFSPYNWIIDINGSTALKGTGTAFKKIEAYEEMGLAAILGCEKENYQPVLSADKKKVSFKIVSFSKQTPEDLGSLDKEFNVLPGELASGIYSEAEAEIEKLIQFLRYEFKPEGMYVVEHILLRPEPGDPNTTPASFMPICIDANGNYCKPLDPYSFRIAVILPGYTMRMRNKDFRRFVERQIRLETPAHILPRICFIGETHMSDFEKAWENWLKAKQDGNNNASKDLINVLEDIYTVYNEGTLGDCDDDTEETNPMILGQTNLGTL